MSLAFLRDRLPPPREMLLVFGLCFTLVYGWSMLAFFNYLPGWMMYLNAWDILGLFAYNQVFALLESAAVFALLLLLSALLPVALLRRRFLSLGSVMLVLAAAGAVFLHFWGQVPLWPSKTLFLGLLAYLAAVGAAWLALRRFEGLERAIEAALDRVVLLLYLYLPLAALGVALVVVRNLMGVF